jgi:tetratricopeptide (TPR) repeat protein
LKHDNNAIFDTTWLNNQSAKNDTITTSVSTFETDTVKSPIDSTGTSEDSIPELYHSPSKASMLSAVFPGLGQIYNKKYWKLPIIYAGVGICIYSIYFAQRNYDRYLTAYKQRLANDPNNLDEFSKKGLGEYYNVEALTSYKDFYRRNRDLSYIILGGIYVLNIIDATVDGYLFDYDVSPDLTLHFTPVINYSAYSNNFALSCSIRF